MREGRRTLSAGAASRTRHGVRAAPGAILAALALVVLAAVPSELSAQPVPMRAAKRVIVAAHRGGAGLEPENSLKAFKSAIALGVDALELDVHMTSDGELVVMHDATLDRTTTGSGPVSAKTLADLASLKLKSSDGTVTEESIPTLAAVLDLAASSSVAVMPEIKLRHDGKRYEGIEERLISLLRSQLMLDRVVVQSFDVPTLKVLHDRIPALPIVLLVGRGRLLAEKASAAHAVRWASELQATHLGMQHELIDDDVMLAVRKTNVRIAAWTVNDDAALRRMVGLGVDMLITDRPDLALRVLGR